MHESERRRPRRIICGARCPVCGQPGQQEQKRLIERPGEDLRYLFSNIVALLTAGAAVWRAKDAWWCSPYVSSRLLESIIYPRAVYVFACQESCNGMLSMGLHTFCGHGRNCTNLAGNIVTLEKRLGSVALNSTLSWGTMSSSPQKS